MKLTNTLKISLVAGGGFWLIASTTTVGSSAASEPTKSPADLMKIVKNAGVFPAKLVTVAEIAANEATVVVVDFDTEKDMRIDAVLLARVVFEKLPALSILHCRYFATSGMTGVYKQVDVSRTQIKAFAAGVVTREQLLASLEIKHLGVVPLKTGSKLDVGTLIRTQTVGMSNGKIKRRIAQLELTTIMADRNGFTSALPRPKDGPLMFSRYQIWARLDDLKKHKYDVSKHENIYNQMEALIRHQDLMTADEIARAGRLRDTLEESLGMQTK